MSNYSRASSWSTSVDECYHDCSGEFSESSGSDQSFWSDEYSSDEYSDSEYFG